MQLHSIWNLTVFFQLLKLQAAIKYGEEDLAGAKSLVDQCPADDQDTEINRGLTIINIEILSKS